MKNGWHDNEEIKNENIPPEAIAIWGHWVRKKGKEITSYYCTAKNKYSKVGNKKGDKPIHISKEEYLEDIRIAVGGFRL